MEEEELYFKTDIEIPDSFYNECISTEYNINDLDKIIKLINESDPLNQFKGLNGLSKLFLINDNANEPNLLYNDINKLFYFLENFPIKFKIECLNCLAGIESYNLKINYIIKNEPTDKIIKIILYILEFPNLYTLNLLKSNLDYLRLLVKNYNILQKIGAENLYKKIRNLFEKVDSNEIIIISRSLEIINKILERNQELTENEDIAIDLIIFLNDLMIKYDTNKEILILSLKIIFSVTSDNVDIITEVQSKIMDKIIEINLLKKIIDKIDKLNPEDDYQEILYNMRIVGNFGAMENSLYTDKIIELNVFDKLKLLMQDKYSIDIRKETAWIISNIAAGTIGQLTKLYENNFQDILFDNIININNESVKINCLWALYNFSNIPNIECLNSLIEKGFINIIMERLKIDTGDVLGCSLEALNNILNRGKNLDPTIYNIIENKVYELDILNELKNYLINEQPNQMIISKIQIILNNYFEIKNIEKFVNNNINNENMAIITFKKNTFN